MYKLEKLVFMASQFKLISHSYAINTAYLRKMKCTTRSKKNS